MKVQKEYLHSPFSRWPYQLSSAPVLWSQHMCATLVTSVFEGGMGVELKLYRIFHRLLLSLYRLQYFLRQSMHKNIWIFIFK